MQSLTFATDALNSKYSNAGSVVFTHTYNGGNQVISTKHSDGSEGSFNTKIFCEPTRNFMDVEVAIYVKNNIDELKTNKNMKQNTIKLNESQLKKIVAESVKKVLNESSSSIATFEDLCMIVGCSLDNQQEAQLKIEQMLMYLHHRGVIKGFNEDKLDWIFSDEQSY
jgi:paraquat-inducible protein B